MAGAVVTVSLIDHAPWRPISPSWATARRLGVLLTTVALLAVGAVVLWAVDAGRWWWIGILAPIAAVGLFQIGNSGRLCRARQYAETEDELLERHGLLNRSLTVVPYGRLQSVDVTQGPFERMLGLASVKMQTGSLIGSPIVHGLEHADAQALADRLMHRAKERQWTQ